MKYNIFNYTDGIYANLKPFKTKKAAEQFIVDFRKQYEFQGYYRDSRRNMVAIEDIDLRVIEETVNPFEIKDDLPKF